MAKNQNNKAEETVLAQPNFVEKYGKKICIGIAAVVVVALGWMGYKHFISEPKEQAANEAIAASQKQIQQGDSTSYVAAQKSLETFVKEYGSTDAGNLAHVYMGISLFNQGKYKEALAEFEEYDDCDDANVTPAVYAAKGDCNACLKQYDEALKCFDKAADKASHENLKVMYLLKAGEICEFAKNDKKAALEYYNKAYACKASYQVQGGLVDECIQRASN